MIWNGRVGIPPLAMESCVRDEWAPYSRYALQNISKSQINILLEPRQSRPYSSSLSAL